MTTRIGWKKVVILAGTGGHVVGSAVLKLEIRGEVVKPYETIYLDDLGSSAFKLRTSKYKVIGAFRCVGSRLVGKLKLKKGEYLVSSYDRTFKYRVGRVYKPEYGFNDDPSFGCAAGLHYFKFRKEATAYAC